MCKEVTDRHTNVQMGIRMWRPIFRRYKPKGEEKKVEGRKKLKEREREEDEGRNRR